MPLLRTDNAHPAFRALVLKLDAHLAITDEDEHDFYHQFNGLADLHHVVLLTDEETDEPLACGAFKRFGPQTVEIKRMYTVPAVRGRGLAVEVLAELERWAAAEGYRRAVLETGIRQPYAIRLYAKTGYERVPNYGPYAGAENSVCLAKKLTD